MKPSSSRLRSGPLAALAGLIALGVWAVAVEPPPMSGHDPLLVGSYPLNFGRYVRLEPMSGHPDEAVVEAFLRRRDESSPFFGWPHVERLDRGQIDMGRFRVEPGREREIVFVVRGVDACVHFYGCTGYVLTRTANREWTLLTTFDVEGNGLGFTVAARPFWARPMLPSGTGLQELDHGPRILVRPVNSGRPTFVGRIYATYWNGTQWKFACRQLCEHR